MVPPADSEDPLATLSFETYEASVKIGAGVFLAAQEALKGFRSPSHSSNPKSFIVTGNLLAFVPASNTLFFGLSLQKKLAAHTIEQMYNSYTAKNKSKEGIRFHYAHVAADDGNPPPYPVFQASGKAHATAFWNLTSSEEAEEWNYR